MYEKSTLIIKFQADFHLTSSCISNGMLLKEKGESAGQKLASLIEKEFIRVFFPEH